MWILLASFMISALHADAGKLVLTGSSTIAPLVLDMAKRFESRHAGLRVDVQTGGSSRGINDQRQGLNDIGMVSRDLHPDEADLEAHLIARDGVAIIVHKTNPVKELSRAQIISIYTGQIKNWREVGGPDSPITVVNKAEGRSTLELFLHHFGLKNSQVKASVLVGDNEQDIKTVAGSPAAIGYVSIGSAENDIKRGVAIKALPLDGVAPTTVNLKAGKFALARPLNLVTKKNPPAQVLEFIRFAQSREVHPLVEQQFFVPVAK